MDRRTSTETPAFVRPHRSLRWLLFIYSLFIVYGSFIPFSFNLDPVYLDWRLGLFLTESLGRGMRHFSTLDVISNVLLFGLWGFLWATALRHRRSQPALRAALRLGGFGFLFGFVIELAQISARYRNPSMLDVLCNGIGATLGAILGQLVQRGDHGSTRTVPIRTLRERPWVVLLVFLLFAPAAEALFPYQISFDIRTVWAKLIASTFIPFSRGFSEPWLELFAERLLFFAAIGFTVRRLLQSLNAINAVGATWLTCSAIALFLETVKFIVVGRAFNVDNLALSSTGAMLGAVFFPGLVSLNIVTRYSKVLLVLLAVGLIGYSELTPLDWIYSTELSIKMASIEWLPFKNYFFIDPLFAAFDLGKKLYISIPLGFALAAQAPRQNATNTPYRATVFGLIIGAILEATQIALRSRTPSLTDVLLLGLGAWIGAAAFEYLHFPKFGQSPADTPLGHGRQ